MATSVDTLIANAISRTNGATAVIDILVTELRQFVNLTDDGIDLPGIKNPDGTVTSGLDLSRIIFPEYQAPLKDATPNPTYVPPNSQLPDEPELADVGNVTLPAERAEPVLNLSNLFKQVAPSVNLPDFTQLPPEIDVPALIAELNAIAKPIIADVQIPLFTPMTIGAAPDVYTPDFGGAPLPDEIGTPEDYTQRFDLTYHKMLPEMQGFIDDKVLMYVEQNEPDNALLKNALSERIKIALNGGGLLSEDLETAIYVRARGRVEKEYATAQLSILESYARNGLIHEPGTVTGAIAQARLNAADSLANVSNDIYQEKRRTEIETLKFAISSAYSDTQSVRSAVLNYIGTIANTIQASVGYSQQYTDFAVKVFDHFMARANVQVSIMEAFGKEFELRLKASLARLDVYKAQLDAEKVKKDVEIAQLQFIESQVKIEELHVKLYSELQDSVLKKAEFEKLKLDLYKTEADVFKNNTQAKLAAFDVYKASLEGDKLKQEGELSKLEVFQELMKSDQIKLESQVKAIEATTKANENRIDVYKAKADVFKLDIETALQLFTVQADIKKLAQSVYGQEIDVSVKTFEADFEAKKTLMLAMIEQYKLSVQTAIEEAKLKYEKLRIAERASEAAVGAYGDIASSASGSMNSVVSQAISASS
jgi:hypothetical protein